MDPIKSRVLKSGELFSLVEGSGGRSQPSVANSEEEGKGQENQGTGSLGADKGKERLLPQSLWKEPSPVRPW